jgi:putative transcriptional regulator
MSNETEIKKGSLLIAEPFMWDPNFKRTVTLICENEENTGAFGFVLNRPMEMKLHEAINGIKKFSAPLYYGGPVELDTLHFLHTLKDLDDAIEICEGLYWGGNFEALKIIINSGKVSPNDFRFFLGYSGWEAGQLKEEMKEKSWIIHQVKPAHLFKMNAAELWKIVLQELGGEYKQMINFPEDPTYN